MAHPEPEPEPFDPRRGSVNVVPGTEEAQPVSDGAAPIDDSAVPPLTAPADTKGG